MEAHKEYTNGEVTVVWQPRKCIHSENCFHGLPKVFKPKEKPWIDTSGALSSEIINQVNKCPSGALSAYLNSEGPKQEETMSKIKIQIFENGPLRVSGELEITHKDGSTEVKESGASLCRCGHSAKKPYCDGSHKKEGFVG